MDPVVHGDAGAEFNAFIGRDRELAELRELAPQTRALTLCGPGGIGKTRLAVHLVAELSAGYPDGAWLVELAELRQPELVAARIAEVVGVTEEPGRPLLATLADALRSRRMLLCLDNCEHLIDACAQLCHRLLASSPGLRIVATSREPLRVAAETIWTVPPLSLPADGQLASPAGAGRPLPDALELFADRARAVQPGFVLGPGNLAAVTRICRSLDGLPLAIELAAVWVRVLTVDQIATRLADRFRLLNSADRTATPRHRTLRAAIDWSHELLSVPEQILLRRLSVFTNCSLEMAEELCADDGADGIPAAAIVDLLTTLADKSLVVAEPDGHGGIRYRMLDTIREYAAARLTEAGESIALHDRFRDYTVAECERLALVGMARVRATWADRVASIQRAGDDTPNLRQVLGRALIRGDAEAGLRICASMRPVWIIQGSFAEGLSWIDSLLSLDRSKLPDEVHGAALIGRAQLTMATDPVRAGEYAADGLRLCQRAGAGFWAASALNLLAEAALHAGQPELARTRAEEAADTGRQAGDRFNEGYALGTLSALAAIGGDFEAAEGLAGRALAICYEIDQQWGAARALMGLADLARLTGRPDEAQRHYQEALATLTEISAKPEIARCLAGLGRIAFKAGDRLAARRYFGESLTLSRQTGSRIGVIRGLDAFAALTAAEGDHATAVRLAGAAAALREAAGVPPRSADRTEQFLAGAAGLDADRIADLRAEGAALSSDAAVNLALGYPAAHARPGSVTKIALPLVSAEQPPGEQGEPDFPGQGGGPGQGAGPAGGSRLGGGLTPRELQIAGLLATGSTNRAIAQHLVISQATVARHVANIMAKLGASSRAEVAAMVRGRRTSNATDRA
jgi:predicted ATPase/DNA-binding CsgD family transcriptional regulator